MFRSFSLIGRHLTITFTFSDIIPFNSSAFCCVRVKYVYVLLFILYVCVCLCVIHVIHRLGSKHPRFGNNHRCLPPTFIDRSQFASKQLSTLYHNLKSVYQEPKVNNIRLLDLVLYDVPALCVRVTSVGQNLFFLFFGSIETMYRAVTGLACVYAMDYSGKRN